MSANNIIKKKSFRFSLSVLELYKYMLDNREYIISKQLLRCSTSIGANIEEALAGFSKKDFTAKMSIASKEARETKYWLTILNESNFIEKDLSNYIIEIDHIINILTKIVKTSSNNQK